MEALPMDAGGVASLSLGERMILPARLAVAAPLRQWAAPVDPAPADTHAKRIAIGGAGPVWIASDATPHTVRFADNATPRASRLTRDMNLDEAVDEAVDETAVEDRDDTTGREAA